jgi:hypothetical protein
MARYPLRSEPKFKGQTNRLNHYVLHIKCKLPSILGYITVASAVKVVRLHTFTSPLLPSIQSPPRSVCSRPNFWSTHIKFFVHILYTPPSRSSLHIACPCWISAELPMYPCILNATTRISLLVECIESIKFTLIRDGRGDEGGAAGWVGTNCVVHMRMNR